MTTADFPASRLEQVPPTGVDVLAVIHENLTLNFRIDRAPVLTLPSLWRLAKCVTGEVTPLYVFHLKEPKR